MARLRQNTQLSANGVVMITTKKGKNGKPVITFNTSVGVSKVINKADVLSPKKWIQKVNLLQGLDENADPTTWMIISVKNEC